VLVCTIAFSVVIAPIIRCQPPQLPDIVKDLCLAKF